MSKIDKGFTPEKIKTLKKKPDLFAPSEVLLAVNNKQLDLDDYDNMIGILTKKTALKKAQLSRTKSMRVNNKDKIDVLRNKIKLLQKYRDRIKIIPEGLKTLVGKGITTQPKRKAYKIDNAGKYGNLIIDVPKLMGHLRLIAKKGDQTVIDKKVDFDTIDLLTTRFKTNKKYSDLSKRVFDELNRLSDRDSCSQNKRKV